MIARKILILVCLISFLSSSFYMAPNCYGNFNTAWNTAEAHLNSDISRCSYAILSFQCTREARYSFNQSIGNATTAWENCLSYL